MPRSTTEESNQKKRFFVLFYGNVKSNKLFHKLFCLEKILLKRSNCKYVYKNMSSSETEKKNNKIK